MHARKHWAGRATAVLAVAVLMLGGSVAPARADLQGEMNRLFDGLANTTNPGAFSTARRGVLAGGSVYARVPIVDDRLVSFVPPSFEAGCGGIDFFAGSFSFINADQFVAMMKAVAANAAGYAFQIALSNMCESCMGAIETLQKKVQELNQFFGNSCQLAQGIVNDAASAMDLKRVNDASLINTVHGIGDVFESFWTGTTGENSESRAAAAAPEAYERWIQGNVVWRALKRQEAQTWFALGDNALLEVAMNITGSVIVGELVEDEAERGEAPIQSRVRPRPELLEAMIEGGEVTILGCGDGYGPDACRELVSKTVTIDGFKQRLVEVLLGTPGENPGALLKIARDLGELDDTEQVVVNMLKDGTGGLALRLAQLGELPAWIFVRQAAPQLALELSETVIRGLLDAVAGAIASSSEAHVPEVREMVRESSRRIDSQVHVLQVKYGNSADIVRSYRELMDALPTATVAQEEAAATPAM